MSLYNAEPAVVLKRFTLLYNGHLSMYSIHNLLPIVVIDGIAIE